MDGIMLSSTNNDFCFINTKNYLSEVCSSPELNEVIYEYLSEIDKELQLLNKYNVIIPLNRLDLNHLCVVERSQTSYGKYIVVNVFQLDIATQIIKHKLGTWTLPEVYPFDELLTSIRLYLSKISTSDKSTIAKPTTNKVIILPSKKPASNPIFNQQRVIPEVVKKADDNDDIISPLKKMAQVSDDDIDTMTPEELEELMTQLEKEKHENLAELNTIKKQHQNDVENYSRFHNELNQERRLVHMNKERQMEKHRVFDTDKGIFYRMREEIRLGKRQPDNIPTLNDLDKKFTIFRFMDAKELLDKEDDYVIYCCLYDETYPKPKKTDGESYIPHNYHYLSPEDQAKYDNIRKTHKDDIEDFIKNETQPIPSLDSVLQQLDDEDDLVDENDVRFDDEPTEETTE